MQTFEEHLTVAVNNARIVPRQLPAGECQSPSGQRCRLCHAVNLDYQSELKLKNDALQGFWKTLRLSLPLAPLIPSPLGRYYRTTTKRRAFAFRDSVSLGLISPNEDGKLKPFPVVQCAIEPIEHDVIYGFIQERLIKPYAKRLAKALNYVVIKGGSREQTVIFNVKEITAEIVHAANTLSKSLTSKLDSVCGLFLYEESANPQYYLAAKNQNRQPTFKKLFGTPDIYQRVMDRSFLYSPLSFSQINQSILEKMIKTAEDLLQPSREGQLFDLYSGYGLFALCLSGTVRSVIAAEVVPLSIESAAANAKRQKVFNARFLRSDINEETIERIMANAGPNDVVLLDPPRKGTSPGVLEGIAAKKPRRVVHIFCEIDLVSKELKRWQKCGYSATRAIPFDMFPGTADIETMILLEPS